MLHSTTKGLSGFCQPGTAILQREFHGPRRSCRGSFMDLGKSLSDCTTQFLYIDAGEKSCKKKAGISSDQTSWMGSPPDQDLPWYLSSEKTQDTLTAPPQLVVTKASSHLPFTCCLPAWAGGVNQNDAGQSEQSSGK